MELIKEFTYQAFLKRDPIPVGPGPIGDRQIYEVESGAVQGERISGKLLGGGEWFLGTSDSGGRIDVRLQIATDDGAFVYVQYLGMVEFTPVFGEFIGGEREETAFEDQYLRIAPRLESGDPRYAWVNDSLFVGEGRGCPGFGIEYQVYRVA